MSGPCLGEALSALVDGELDHQARERAYSHLAGCAGCRAELDAERALKARLSDLRAGTPAPPGAVVETLLALAVPGVEPSGLPPAAGRPVPFRPTDPHERRRPASRRPPGRGSGRRTTRLRRTGAFGSCLLAVGITAALALGGPSGSPASTPVDPGTDAFVVDFVSTTSTVPRSEPAGGAASSPGR